jgi:NHLM bacteriocin system ABC transporter ATP-binding protein
MGYFDELIRQKEKNDEQRFEDAFVGLASVVMGDRTDISDRDRNLQIRNAFSEILEYYRMDDIRFFEETDSFDEQLDFFTRQSGLMKRTVKLTGNWYSQAIGPFLAFFRDSEKVVTLMPCRGGYCYLDYTAGKQVRITKQNASVFKTEAYCFYKPFPAGKMAKKDLFHYMLQILTRNDIGKVLGVIALMVLGSFGVLLVNESLVYQTITEAANAYLSYVYIIGALFICVISVILLKAIAQYMVSKIKTRVGSAVQAAIMMRIVALPTDFFRGFSSGELAGRAHYISGFCDTAADTFIIAVPMFVLTLLYDIYLISITPVIGWLVLLEMAILLSFTAVCYYANKKYISRKISAASVSSGVNYNMINGIQKIKLAGAEKRAFSKWSDVYRKNADIAYNPPLIVKITQLVPVIIPMFFIILIYYMFSSEEIYLGVFYTYELVYEAISAEFIVLFRQLMSFAESAAAYDMAKPIFETVPETSDGKRNIGQLKGKIEISHVSFRYNRDMPFLYENLDLQIEPGQYVAIVGKSGCGKSTLVRLLLGFEKPERGAIYYDGQDIRKINLQSLRRKIGTVMQNARLFTGDIYYNILISAPWLKMQDAWDAAETAGIADDIRKMPMGMQTMLSEDQSGLSGGQRQRLVIARAIAQKPNILIMDEATSALDNVTQKKISDALGALSCTRIVIAHRLSTVRECDRILVLDKGKIAEDGTYSELIEKKGIFADLAARQQIGF